MAPPRRRLPGAPADLGEAVRLGLAGGAALVGAALLAGLLTRATGGDGLAALGNVSLLAGMATLGVAAVLGGVRASRWWDVHRGGEAELRRRARVDATAGTGLVRVSLAVAGALPFVLFVALAVARG